MKFKYLLIPILLFFLIDFLPYRVNLYRYFWRKLPSEGENRIYVKEVIDGDTIRGKNRVYVKEVIDGDTIRLRNRKKVRLIGIDTPELYECDKLFRNADASGFSPKEIQKMGRESYLFTKKMCEKKFIFLEFDQQKYDKYGRILAYVHLSDGTILNQEIIKQGYGLAYLNFPFNREYRENFARSQKEAKKHNRGLWNKYPNFGRLK